MLKPHVYEFENVTPVIHETAFVHPQAVLIGDVIVGSGCYIGPFASLRGDFGRIVVEQGANVQDSCALHAFPEKAVIVESNCHIGHGAILHGCHIKSRVLVGMNAVIMDGAVVHLEAFVGACSFVKAGMQVPPRHLAMGNPAEIIRELSQKEIDAKADGTRYYQILVQRCRRTLKPVEAKTEIEDNRSRVTWGETA